MSIFHLPDYLPFAPLSSICLDSKRLVGGVFLYGNDFGLQHHFCPISFGAFNGVRILQVHEESETPYRIYCNIGHCFEYRITVIDKDGIRECFTSVEDGMEVLSGPGAGSRQTPLKKGGQPAEWMLLSLGLGLQSSLRRLHMLNKGLL